MKSSVAEIKVNGKSFRERVSEMRLNMQKAMTRDFCNTLSVVNARIESDGFDTKFRETYARTTKYAPFQGADKANKKGKKVFMYKKIVSRSGDTQEAFSPIRFVQQTDGRIFGSNKSPDFSLEARQLSTGGQAVITITGKSAKRVSKRYGIIRNAVKSVKKDWSDFKKAVKSDFKNEVRLLRAQEQSQKGKR